jgi:hypothetical protein
MNLREEFKKETGLNTIITGTFDDDVQIDIWNDKYIEWLENELKKLRVDDVIKEVCDCKKYGIQPARMCSAEKCMNKLDVC